MKRKQADELSQAVSALDAARQALSAQSKAVAHKRNYHDALKALDQAESRNAFVEEINRPIRVKDLVPKSAKSRSPAMAFLCLSDWHIEETVKPISVNGQNEFNTSIASKRIRNVFARMPTLMKMERAAAEIDTLVVWLGGDLITGYIHEELQESNGLSPTEACLLAQEEVANGLTFLLRHCDFRRIIVVTNYGNHGRTTQKSRISTGYQNSFEWLMYVNLAREFKNEKRIHWQIGRSYHNLLNVYDKYLIRFHHGDSIRYQGGVGGISIPVNKAIAQWNKATPAYLDVFGHWHQWNNALRWISVPCLIGYNAYALSIKADYEDPAQAFFVIDRDRGLTTAKRVFCE